CGGSLCVCVGQGVQRRFPDPRQCCHGDGIPVWGEDQPERAGAECRGPQRSVSHAEGQRGHLHPQVGQGRRHTRTLTHSPTPSDIRARSAHATPDTRAHTHPHVGQGGRYTLTHTHTHPHTQT